MLNHFNGRNKSRKGAPQLARETRSLASPSSKANPAR
jgi:hypothetical protein